MKEKRTLIITIVTLIVLIGAAAVAYKILGPKLNPGKASDFSFITVMPRVTSSLSSPITAVTAAPTPATSKAPDFTVYDASGKAVKLSDFIGKPVVVNIWASWCPPCKAEMPHFQKLSKEYASKVEFLMVNVTDGQRETQDTAQSFLNSNHYTFPAYFDIDGSAASAYSVTSIPMTIIIDSNGNLAGGFKGSINETTLRNAISKVYSENP